MDNKTTKKRLNDMLSYEWILMIIVAVACVIVWELIFALASVKPTIGQRFLYVFDSGVSMQNNELNEMINDGKLLSYDILIYEGKEVDNATGTDMLNVYLENGDCDVLFIDETAGYNETVRLKQHIDYNYMYCFDTLLSDAKEYLNTFLTNGEIDDLKVEAVFNKRMKKDNRFKSKEEKAQGVALEKARIEKLQKDVCDFEKILSCGQDIFYNYTRFEQLQAQEKDIKEKELYERFYREEKEEGRENAIYGIDLGKLPVTQGKKSVTEYVVLSGTNTANGVIVAVGNFKKYQPDMQFESLSFINEIVRTCTDILN